MNQPNMPGFELSDVETMVRELADAGRLDTVSVSHKMAYTGGWKPGWFAYVGFDYKPDDRQGNHPSIAQAHDLHDPIAALVKALAKAKAQMQ